ncbi:hypothetical protein [Brevibacillus laterosporus]|uniref:hypothetical protein n=1 Tax=Brevibacillus laterosporus TaxID=1465 RepID=UPI002653D799|nr:hypothetical protein [Brevibacillus laterosporus]MDN9009563.1 hypothetical protein [Brevibacillus laterosporus]MDO0940438.1 hypothetical protein [Brevibacillus laterosporus]
MNAEKQAVFLLQKILPDFVNCTMEIQIIDVAEDAEKEVAPPIHRHLAKWELIENDTIVRLYFNSCQFIAIPAVGVGISVKQLAVQRKQSNQEKPECCKDREIDQRNNEQHTMLQINDNERELIYQIMFHRPTIKDTYSF